MRVTNRMLVDNLRLNIAQNAETLADLQTQLSSGKRLRKPSDDPQELSRALSVKSSIDQNNQYQRNISTARSWLEAADSNLNQLMNLLTRARNVALRGANGTQGTEERARLAEQADGLLQEGLQAANATHEGKYLFGGRMISGQLDAVTGLVDPPFTIEPDPVTGVDEVNYNGDSGEMKREIDKGVELAVNIPGDFAAGGVGSVLQKALTTLNDLKRHLTSDPSALSSDIEAFSECVDRVSDMRGIVGVKESRLDATESSLTDRGVGLKISLSRAQDADVAEVMTKLMMQENVYKAALNIGARVIQPSLLDFLR